MTTLLQMFPDPKDLLALGPEDLAGALMEVIPGVSQSPGFQHANLLSEINPPHGGGYAPGPKLDECSRALSEAIAWLEVQGLVARNLNQPALWYFVTRRGLSLKTRSDVNSYRLSRTLPIELLPAPLVEKVHHLFLRGDYETAVFQAFKMVEVEVRRAAECEPGDVGVKLMRKAFDPRTGPLTMKFTPTGEQEAMSALFAGAIGYAKNPASHRDVRHTRVSAARLIVFAAELLEIVDFAEIIG
jgi:uncharacterized protein (TIGR02391 family)